MDVSVSLGYFPFNNDLLLHPILIIIKIKSYSSNTLPLMNSTTELNVTENYISQNYYDILLLMWNFYKYLFETQNNLVISSDGVSAYKYNF